MKKIIIFTISYFLSSALIVNAQAISPQYAANEVKIPKGLTILYSDQSSNDSYDIHKKYNEYLDAGSLGIYVDPEKPILDFYASPDHKKFAFNFNKQNIGLWDTDELHDNPLLTDGYVEGLIWAPDSSAFFVILRLSNESNLYEALIYDLKSRKLSSKGKFELKHPYFENFHIKLWSDNKIYFFVGPKNHPYSLYSFNLDSNEVTNLSQDLLFNESFSFDISNSGKYIVSGEDHVYAPCDWVQRTEVDKYAPSKFSLGDLKTGKKIVSFGLPGTAIKFLGFSPDETEVFFAAEIVINKKCDSKTTRYRYFRKNIVDKNAHLIRVNSKRELLSLMHPNEIIFRKSEVKKGEWEFLKNGTVFFRLPDPDNRLQIIDAY